MRCGAIQANYVTRIFRKTNCLGSISDYCPYSPKTSGGDLFQTGGITELMFNMSVVLLNCH